jgi:hypothetical protein
LAGWLRAGKVPEDAWTFPMVIRVQSRHFLVEQLEDGWMVEASHVTKDNKGDWMMDHEEMEELAELLQRALEA